MRPISHKNETLRRAVAESRLLAAPETFERLRANDLPKKDVLATARAAAMLAAKKTPDLIPDCHPILLEFLGVEFEFAGEALIIRVTAEAVAKTGVEMEALTASSVAALTVYDMLKPIDKALEITGTKLISKTGGKSDRMEKIPANFKAAVVVTSDSTSQGRRDDSSGRAILERLRASGLEAEYQVLPDDVEMIRTALAVYCEQGFHLVLTTGGTGLGPRDVTVEATAQVIDREIPGIMEAARAYGQRRTPYAMLSRGLAGQKGNTILITLPGSTRGVEESLDAIFPAVLHSYKMMRGGSHETKRTLK